MKFIDLFAGIGGFRYGLEGVDRNENRRSKENTQRNEGQRLHPKKGKEISTKKRQSSKQSNSEPKQRTFTCVYSNEWDKYAAQIYKKHYGECDTTDITKVKAKDIPDHDLLCAGFPCQSFSIAGKRKGFDDTRGTLFFDIARIVSKKRPRYLLLENVKGLLSHDKGKTFQTILGVLSDLGYGVEWQVLNSKHFGVPQNRERVFIVGHLRGEFRPKVFPITQNSELNIVLPTLTARYWGGQANGGYIGNKPKQIIGGSQGNRVYDPDGTSTTIASQAGGLGAKTGLYAISSSQRKDHVEVRVKGGEANTVTSSGGSLAKSMNFVKQDMKIRRLTPTECERLQGFPDGWTEFGTEGRISDTQRYKTLGNAVTTNVITAIGEAIWLNE